MISRDATATGSAAGSSVTFSHTTSGKSRLLLVVATALNSNGTTVIAATYNGVSMTAMGANIESANLPRFSMRGFYLLGPASGTHDVVINASDGGGTVAGISASYKDVLNSAYDAIGSAEHHEDPGETTETLTTIADNSWPMMILATHVTGGLTPTQSALENRNFQVTVAGQDYFLYIYDLNGPKTPAGLVTFGYTRSGGNQGVTHQMISFAPSSGIANVHYF